MLNHQLLVSQETNPVSRQVRKLSYRDRHNLRTSLVSLVALRLTLSSSTQYRNRTYSKTFEVSRAIHHTHRALLHIRPSNQKTNQRPKTPNKKADAKHG